MDLELFGVFRHHFTGWLIGTNLHKAETTIMIMMRVVLVVAIIIAVIIMVVIGDRGSDDDELWRW